MQIKRGPFGYFATEKFDSPDRLCTYAEEVIAGNKSDFYLTPVTEQNGAGAMCYFEFSGFLSLNVKAPLGQILKQCWQPKHLSAYLILG